jgi:ABC-type nitrate/sulfonate/bicarbonate transport system substrate-binding protein
MSVKDLHNRLLRSFEETQQYILDKRKKNARTIFENEASPSREAIQQADDYLKIIHKDIKPPEGQVARMRWQQRQNEIRALLIKKFDRGVKKRLEEKGE